MQHKKKLWTSESLEILSLADLLCRNIREVLQAEGKDTWWKFKSIGRKEIYQKYNMGKFKKLFFSQFLSLSLNVYKLYHKN